MNWNEATLEQCSNFLNNRIGSNISWLCPDGTTRDMFPPPTLDSISASLPEGCRWDEIDFEDDDEGQRVKAVSVNPIGTAYRARSDNDSDVNQIKAMILAMARCACLAWEASGK